MPLHQASATWNFQCKIAPDYDFTKKVRLA